MQHWTAIWGNAVSIAENRPERYAKDITIRYPIRIPFDGELHPVASACLGPKVADNSKVW